MKTKIFRSTECPNVACGLRALDSMNLYECFGVSRRTPSELIYMLKALVPMKNFAGWYCPETGQVG